MAVEFSTPAGQAVAGTQQKDKLTSIGRAWKNTSKKNTEFLRVSIDQKINGQNFDHITLKPGDKLLLTANAKREGKKDADFRLHIVEKVA